MKVSVIVAAYNIEDYIERCLISLVNQTLNQIEIIVVNDGSTDQTKNIIETISKKDDRVIVINQENKGLIEARKSGFKRAKGDFILFIDGDDWLEKRCLEILYNKAEDRNLDIVMYNAFNSYDSSKEKFNTFNLQNKDDVEEILEDPLKYLFKGDILPCIWSKFIKKEYIIKNKIIFPSNISFAEDLATVSTLFMYEPKVGLEDQYLYNYYQRETSLTKKKSEKILELDKAILFIEEHLHKTNLYKSYIESFEYMIFNHLFFKWFLITYNDCNNDIGKKLLGLYLNRKLNIKRNRYINKKISKYPLSFRLRIKCYHNGYIYGKLYDKLRYLLKGY